MHTEAERIFYRRIYILIALTAAIVCGLFYLMFLTRIKADNSAIEVSSFLKTEKRDKIVTDNNRSIIIPVPSEQTPSEPEPNNTDQPEKPEAPDTQTADVTTNSSVLRIVSPAHRINADYVPDRLVIPDVPMYQIQQLRADAAESLEEMFAAARSDGYDLYLISGYRSYDYQQGLWNYYEDYYGLNYTQRLDAHPGGSEHQLGLSVDIGTTDDYCRLDTCFGDTGAFAWLQNNSYRFGYIERYPIDKESITGIMYSPWSFRYIGTDEAEKLYQAEQTMEEYYNLN